MSDVAKESNDVAVIVGLAKLTAEYHDAVATLLIGKTALERGMVMDQYAFPDFGVPAYSAIGAAVDLCIVYSVARTESAFDQNDRSSANAVGLMQVTPEAGRDTAKRFGVAFTTGIASCLIQFITPPLVPQKLPPYLRNMAARTS